ncbi:class I SAM-dependent methyltransferase [Leptothoe sp. PORK10 BA2]|uniref:class I SAM-dependent methyltransferase n=1 Tax=Leptothoe sp. PORK10 BA2 TaxID=3110254 RepID=UPI002B200212|nr:class I SAM-dependent methyltransferase [Leptothoe sp. PORK10 BA2]MEA5465715.1 class I SAM-dependent methyltransferase [Leptothoe sp. PORK10 BA2]
MDSLSSMDTLNPTERFSNRVADYVKYRPDYPASLMDYLVECVGLKPEHVVADVGAGTGLLTQLFLKQGNRVYGIEPNPPMRAAAEDGLRAYGNFVSVAGQAEATTLEATSIDWIAAGQAFHWFDQGAARLEFSRILKPGGWVALIWNSRLMSDPFHQAYEHFLLAHLPDYSRVKQRRPTAEELAVFFAPAAMTIAAFDHQQVFDFSGLRGRLLSCSYAPKEDGANCGTNYGVMMEELRSLFERYSHQGQLIFRYTTHLYYAQPYPNSKTE